MDGTMADFIVIPIVVVISLAAWLVMVSGQTATRVRRCRLQSPMASRSSRTILDGTELLPPGVVRVSEWRPATAEEAATPTTLWGGVGRKALPRP